MSRPQWIVTLLKIAFPSRALAARATHVPLLGSIIDRWLFDGDHLIYLPSDDAFRTDAVIQIDEPVQQPEEIVLPSSVVEHFIEEASTHWIMDRCICRDASHCEDYPIELGCLFLGEAASGINPKLGRPVTKAEALEHVRRCREAGLVHLIGRNKLDTVWLGIGPGDKLMTICHCCPCCCLWRMLPDLAPEIGAKTMGMPGVSVYVNEECVGCASCMRGICFVDAICMEGGRAVIGDACRGCGRCVGVCPQGAIKLSLEHEAAVDEAVRKLAALVQVS